MGCGSGQKQIDMPIRVSTVTGVLKITITEAVIQHRTSTFFSIDPYVKLKFSNQIFKTSTIKKGGIQPKFNESFTFYVNSCYKKYGRNLELQVWDQSKTGDREVGYGILDLDPVINSKVPRSQLRCFLSFERKPAGFIYAIAQFKEQKAQTLSFRFQTASIRRKTRTFGDMNCHVQVTIGQQVLKTSSSKDTQQMPPIWHKDVLTFNVPVVVPFAKIIVFDEQAIIGDLEVNIKQLLDSSSEKHHSIEFDFNDQVAAGTIKFQTICGSTSSFSQVKTVHRKKKQQPEKKQEPAKDQKKQQPAGQKKEDKKEQNKQKENKQQQSQVK